MTRPDSAFLRSLWAPLMEDARREVELALKVAVAVQHGMKPDEIAARLGVARICNEHVERNYGPPT
jgi:hypothetical protein